MIAKTSSKETSVRVGQKMVIALQTKSGWSNTAKSLVGNVKHSQRIVSNANTSA